ncbi:brassinosteroid-responsive RING protein 1-like [Beta vulgaris subsp. vulgaris]|uniref:brassinosteroid-responsive RING protein 1-like n=1 Tax=Beta vulgaris subsp. vulgaris TaxID=3555 RepID=UPI0025474CB8|nr:brassinosteroid-responsive RING protein 1-like [Beta vulgaris subsp. vulgaris]
MGFPAGYTEVLLPKLFLTALSLLGFLRKSVLSLLRLLGLASLIEPASPFEPDHPEPGPALSESSAAALIREMLPAVTYAEAIAAGPDEPGPSESCAVCLHEYESDDEVRRMRNCRHMFHRCCVDRWIDHDRKTCPLCRKPLVPHELQEDFNEKLWAASGIPDFYSEYSPITNFL